jgi:hypothetical protein
LRAVQEKEECPHSLGEVGPVIRTPTRPQTTATHQSTTICSHSVECALCNVCQQRTPHRQRHSRRRCCLPQIPTRQAGHSLANRGWAGSLRCRLRTDSDHRSSENEQAPVHALRLGVEQALRAKGGPSLRATAEEEALLSPRPSSFSVGCWRRGQQNSPLRPRLELPCPFWTKEQ